MLPTTPVSMPALVVLGLLAGISAGIDFTSTCANYYVGNGIADATSGLFIEAWCHGGQGLSGQQRPSLCSRLDLADCYQNVDGQLKPLDSPPKGSATNLASTCDIESCAMRREPWDGPLMSCYCQDSTGRWALTEVNLNHHLGNEGGFLSCGKVRGEKKCKYPWTPEESQEEAELR